MDKQDSLQTQKKKFTQSIFVLQKPFSGFYKGNRGQNEEIYTDLKNVHKHCLQVCVIFHVCQFGL